MLIARILLGFLQMVNNNAELVKTIKKILQVFPEAIVIQSFDKYIDEYSVNFVNQTAEKKIIQYENPCDAPIQDDNIHYLIKTESPLCSANNVPKSKMLTLSNILKEHIEQLNEVETEVSNPIEIVYKDIDDSQELINCESYNLKTVKVNLDE